MDRGGVGVRRSVTLVATTLALMVALISPADAAAGQLDPSFGGDGTVRTLFLGGDPLAAAEDVAVQPDGRILVATTVEEQYGGTEPALLRYLPDGRRDRTFSRDGGVATDVGAFGDGYAVALQSDGRIVLAGDGICQYQQCFALIRYLPGGRRDPSFGGGDGIVKTPVDDLGGAIYDVAIQPDGKIVAAGYRRKTGDALDDLEFALARYEPDGTLDTTFSGDGLQFISFGFGDDEAEAVAVQPDGRIVVAGGGTPNLYESGSDFALARLSPNGSLDTSFSGDGKLTTNFGGTRADRIHGLAIRSDGRIVAAGGTSTDQDPRAALAMYTGSGGLDPSFSGDGKLDHPMGSFGGYAYDVVPTGSLLVVGGHRFTSSDFGEADWTLMRYRLDGSLDTTFDGDGIVVTNLGTGWDRLHELALQPDGKLVAVGDYYSTVGLARYLLT